MIGSYTAFTVVTFGSTLPQNKPRTVCCANCERLDSQTPNDSARPGPPRTLGLGGGGPDRARRGLWPLRARTVRICDLSAFRAHGSDSSNS